MPFPPPRKLQRDPAGSPLENARTAQQRLCSGDDLEETRQIDLVVPPRTDLVADVRVPMKPWNTELCSKSRSTPCFAAASAPKPTTRARRKKTGNDSAGSFPVSTASLCSGPGRLDRTRLRRRKAARPPSPSNPSWRSPPWRSATWRTKSKPPETASRKGRSPCRRPGKRRQVTEHRCREEGAAVEVGPGGASRSIPERRALELANQTRTGRPGPGATRRIPAKPGSARVKKLYANATLSPRPNWTNPKPQLQLSQSRLQSRGERPTIGSGRTRRRATPPCKAPFAGLHRAAPRQRRRVRRSAGQPAFRPGRARPHRGRILSPRNRNSSRVRHRCTRRAVQVSPFPEETLRRPVIHRHLPHHRSSDTRTLRVKAAIDNRDGRLRPRTVRESGPRHLQALERVSRWFPRTPFLQRADGSVLFLMDGTDRVRRLRVATGAYLDGTLVEVREGGIKAGNDRVVVRGQSGTFERIARCHSAIADGSPAGPPTKTVDSRPPDSKRTPRPKTSGGAGG